MGQSPDKSEKSDSKKGRTSEKARVMSPYSRKSDAGGDDGLDGINDYQNVAEYQKPNIEG